VRNQDSRKANRREARSFGRYKTEMTVKHQGVTVNIVHFVQATNAKLSRVKAREPVR
jgi:hypothetical protein